MLPLNWAGWGCATIAAVLMSGGLSACLGYCAEVIAHIDEAVGRSSKCWTLQRPNQSRMLACERPAWQHPATLPCVANWGASSHRRVVRKEAGYRTLARQTPRLAVVASRQRCVRSPTVRLGEPPSFLSRMVRPGVGIDNSWTVSSSGQMRSQLRRQIPGRSRSAHQRGAAGRGPIAITGDPEPRFL